MTWRERKIDSILEEIGAVVASMGPSRAPDLSTDAAVRYRDTHLTVGNIRSAEAWDAAVTGLAAIEAEAHLQGFEKGLEHAKATYGPGHVIAERRRIAEAVREMDGWNAGTLPGIQDCVPRDKVLAIVCGHDLACWCPLDQPCHADVLLELAR